MIVAEYLYIKEKNNLVKQDEFCIASNEENLIVPPFPDKNTVFKIKKRYFLRTKYGYKESTRKNIFSDLEKEESWK